MANPSTVPRVDVHQHFWLYSPAEYGWITEEMSAIRKDFLPEDLQPLLDGAGIDLSIAVQARQSLEETVWLLELAADHEWIAGVAGWVPLADRDVASVLDEMIGFSKLKGIRHVLQGEDDSFMEGTDFNAGVGLLRQHELLYELLVLERQLPAAVRLVDRHPDQAFILDHLAKPQIVSGTMEPWRSNMLELASRPHVSCKLSGMVTEADHSNWTSADLKPYIEVALEAFGPGRLLFGSDWPVCNLASTYSRWAGVVTDAIADLSETEQTSIFGGNAMRLYRIEKSNQDYEVEQA